MCECSTSVCRCHHLSDFLNVKPFPPMSNMFCLSGQATVGGCKLLSWIGFDPHVLKRLALGVLRFLFVFMP